jgi:hypothetical protein
LGIRGGGAAGEALHPTNSRRRTAELGTATALKQAIAASDEKHKKWEFNWQLGHGASNNNDFRDEALCMEGVQCFAMERPETLVILCTV